MLCGVKLSSTHTEKEERGKHIIFFKSAHSRAGHQPVTALHCKLRHTVLSDVGCPQINTELGYFIVLFILVS